LENLKISSPDLGGMSEEWAGDLYETLFTRFARFRDDVVVLPAHATGIREQDAGGIVRLTMSQARKGTDLYQTKNRAAFFELIRASLPENPARYQDIRKVNLGLADPDEAGRKELEIGKNLCGMSRKV
jgi:hypothetical protein